MPSVMSSGLSGLLAFQRALDTTSHNIANASTEGYVRQRVEFGTRPASPFSNGWIGNGVDVQTVRRQVDDFMVAQSRATSGTLGRLDLFAAQSERVSKLFAAGDAGLSGSIQKLQNAIQGVATEPASIAARQVLINESQGVADKLNYIDSQLRTQDGESVARLDAMTGEINGLANGIAQLNEQITSGFGATGQPPNDLLDQRDRLVDQLAARIGINVVPQDQGVLNIFIGRGQALVLGSRASTLGVETDPFDGSRSRISLSGNQGAVDVTSALSGGELGGMLDFRSQVLTPTRNDLGRLAAGIADTLNTQHRAGVDLKGAQGSDLFSTGAPTAVARSTNAGSGQLTVVRESTAGLTSSDYDLQYSGAGWALTRLDTGAAVALTGSGASADPLRADGISIVVSGTPATGDRFQVRPTAEAIAGFSVLIRDPLRLAAATPIAGVAASANVGDASITPGEVVDPANPQLRTGVTLQFLTASTYSVNGAGSLVYTSGQPIEMNGWRVSIRGTPTAGDSFSVADSSSATGDNRNILAMADALNAPRLDGGTTSVTAGLGRLTSTIGVVTQQAQVSRDAQQVLQDDAVAQRQNFSGVNLDEEAANLLRYQQAYQASAQLIRIANEMFQTLLDAAR